MICGHFVQMIDDHCLLCEFIATREFLGSARSFYLEGSDSNQDERENGRSYPVQWAVKF
jgi:hypothetical protein